MGNRVIDSLGSPWFEGHYGNAQIVFQPGNCTRGIEINRIIVPAIAPAKAFRCTGMRIAVFGDKVNVDRRVGSEGVCLVVKVKPADQALLHIRKDCIAVQVTNLFRGKKAVCRIFITGGFIIE